jgi:hypothetical protein
VAYQIEVYPDAREQIQAVPAVALPALAEVMAMLELAPWAGDPLHAANPDGAMRAVSFGPAGAGIIVYLILEDQRRVDVARVLWAR